MNDYEKESELVNRVNDAMGPAQKLVALKELSQLYRSEYEGSPKIQEKYLEILHKCLEISNADPTLWHEFGEACFSLNRLPLALYAYYSASSLDPTPVNLYSYCLCLALTHDYINALSIANYLIDTYNYTDASKIKDFVRFRMQGEGENPGLSSIQWNEVDTTSKVGAKKVMNLCGLCKGVRHLAANKDGDLYVFEKSECKTDAGLGLVKKKEPQFQPPECRYWELIREYKIKVFTETNCLCFGFISPKVFHKSFTTTKATALFEPDIMQFIGTPLTYRKLAYELIHLLCKNAPRPSVLLSGEVSSEIIKIYTLCKDFLHFEDEYLTLLEISLKESKSDIIVELRNNLIQCYKSTEALNLRCYVAIAYSYFNTRSSYEKQQEFLVQQLFNADTYLNKARDLLQNDCLYLWWSDSLITAKELAKFKTDIKIDYELILIDKEIKSSSRLASSALALLDRLTKILAHSHKCDDPTFYWKKIKLILKNLNKLQLEKSEHEAVAVSLSRYIAVLLYNLEDGIKLTNDHDIKGLLTTLTENINYGHLSDTTKAQLLGSCVNLLRYCAKYFQQIPFFFKRVFKYLDPPYLVVIFSDFHGILNAMQKNTDAKFHLNLCKAFEKYCFQYAKDQCVVIYNWLYGLGAKKCTCKANYPTSILSLPNSSNKLSRILDFLHKDWVGTANLPSNPRVLMLLKELYSKEPRFFLSCKHFETRKIEELVNVKEIHAGCCPDTARETAKRGYKLFGMELIGSAIIADLKESMKSLRTAEDMLLQGLYLDPSDSEIWALFGTLYLWKWTLGYFDVIYTFDILQASEEHLRLANVCFDTAIKNAPVHIRRYCVECKSVLLYFSVVADKKCLDNAIDCLQEDLGTDLSRYILVSLRSMKKESVSENLLVGEQPLFKKIMYKKTRDEQIIKQLEESDDPWAIYYAAKLKGNWVDAFNNGFLGLKNNERNILMNRPSFMWKLKRKVGEKCLDIFRTQNDVAGIQLIISKYSTFSGRSRKNKEITRVIIRGIKHLHEIGEKTLALSEIDKNSALNLKDKQSLKAELTVENNENPL